MANQVADGDGREVRAGDTIHFAYGTPPVPVVARVIERGGTLIALTPGHNPAECRVDRLMGYVGYFWIKK